MQSDLVLLLLLLLLWAQSQDSSSVGTLAIPSWARVLARARRVGPLRLWDVLAHSLASAVGLIPLGRTAQLPDDQRIRHRRTG